MDLSQTPLKKFYLYQKTAENIKISLELTKALSKRGISGGILGDDFKDNGILFLDRKIPNLILTFQESRPKLLVFTKEVSLLDISDDVICYYFGEKRSELLDLFTEIRRSYAF